MRKRRENPAAAYRRWHWGSPATHVKDVRLPGVSDDTPLVEIGLLLDLHFDPLAPLPGVPTVATRSLDKAAHRTGAEPERLAVISVEKSDWQHNHIAFDLDHPKERLYLVLSPSSRRDARRVLWRKGAPTIALADLARAAGGHHAADDYPDLAVQALGPLFFVTYYTNKAKAGVDDRARYIHRMGEDGGIEPVLAVSADGNLWIAGGSYTCPTDGIAR